VALGWRVDNSSPVTVSTAYRWITDAVMDYAGSWKEAETYTLFPVEVRPGDVLTYNVRKNGAGLSRESQDIIVPGDYGVYTIGDTAPYLSFSLSTSFSGMVDAMKRVNPSILIKASLSPLIQQALDRDRECIFSGVVPSGDLDGLVATWVFPPFLGYEISDDPWLMNKYYQDTDACDMSELMVIENVVSGRKDIITLFWENKLGVDVEDNYRIIVFEGSETLIGGTPLKSHLTLKDGPHRPSDRFLRLHFTRCLRVSVCRGDVLEDYEEQEIENFMDELGVFDNEIDPGDPRWATPLGSHVHAYLVRQKMKEYADVDIW